MSLATLHDLMIHDLNLYSAERQLVQALPRRARSASSQELQTALENHWAETEEPVARLEELLEEFGASMRVPVPLSGMIRQTGATRRVAPSCNRGFQ